MGIAAASASFGQFIFIAPTLFSIKTFGWQTSLIFLSIIITGLLLLIPLLKTNDQKNDVKMDVKEKMVMRAKDGGLMDLGGKEMDLRGGGFVPIGKKERADDVPARLSKNEFVMTADAVRAAGGGSVNKGAKRMYNLMNSLEARA